MSRALRQTSRMGVALGLVASACASASFNDLKSSIGSDANQILGAAGIQLQQDAADGAVVVESLMSFTDTVDSLTNAINGNEALTLLATVDHAAAAAGVDLELLPTTELFFGNPAVGTPLMQASQSAGIDLPQKMLMWEDIDGVVRVSYNAPSYLESRHNIVGADAQLTTVGGALGNLAGAATGNVPVVVQDAGTVALNEGLVTVTTDRSIDEAYDAIVAALEAAPPVNVIFELDHQANAASVDLELNPTRLVVFGNPALGTQLMQADQSSGLDLPQKILVHTDDAGQTFISYNAPSFVVARHELPEIEILDTLAGALANFAAIGAGEPAEDVGAGAWCSPNVITISITPIALAAVLSRF